MCPWVLQASMQSSQESLLSERRDDETYTTLVWQVDQKERNQQKTEGFFIFFEVLFAPALSQR